MLSHDDAAELRFEWVLFGAQQLLARSNDPFELTHAVVKSSNSSLFLTGDGVAVDRLRFDEPLDLLPVLFTVYLLSNSFIFSSIWESFRAFSAASKICWASGDEFCFTGDVLVDLTMRRPF